MFGELAFGAFSKFKIGSNPILSVILTFVLMLLSLTVGSLNKIAQLSSVLFLLSYFTVNLACLFLEWASAPNFRPKFTGYNILSCGLGCVGCFVMMIVISQLFTAVAWLLLFVCIGIFSFTSGPKYKEWGSIGQALMFHQVRKYLLMMDVRKDHVKFWRPQILLLVSNPRYNCVLIEFINSLKKSGLYVLGHVHVSNFDELASKDPSVTELPHWLELITHLKVKAFPEITVAKSMREGSQQLARISGLGAMKPNTVIFGFGQDGEQKVDQLGGDEKSRFYHGQLKEMFNECNESQEDNSDRAIELMKSVGDMIKLEKNVCLARNFFRLNHDVESTKKFIDVWLIDFFDKPNYTVSDPGQSFMMQLGTILTMTREWKKFQLRVFVRIMEEEDRSAIVRHLEKTLLELRIPAKVVTMEFKRVFSIVEASGAVQEDQSRLDIMSIPSEFMEEINEIIKLRSKDTIVTFLRLPAPPPSREDKELRRMYELLKIQSNNLPPVIYVHGLKTVVSASL